MAQTLSRTVISNIVEKQGLHLLGIATLDVTADYQRFEEWLAAGMHAEMGFLEKHLEIRKDPRSLLPGAKNAIVLGLNYNQKDSLREFKAKKSPWIAQYARLQDYHKVMRKKAEAIVSQIKETPGAQSFQYRICVDSAPLLERALAKQSELGFIGKNSLFIHPKLGSFMLLVEILTDLELDADEKHPEFSDAVRSSQLGGCGSCERCKVHCPTGALQVDRTVDARRCISYWTIEHRGLIPQEMWPYLKDYIFGCDLCQLVCPYNRGAPESGLGGHLDREVNLPEIAIMDQEGYVRMFGGSPATRAKRDGLRRNALIALAVTRHQKLGEVWEALSTDPSDVVTGTCRQVKEYGYLS